jgi:dinuclear metal center YbgI/SA1388 family protein
MTCLTITPTTVAEATEQRANLVVAHHPLPFRPITRLTSATTEGRLLLDLIAAGIAVASPHTAFDSASAGINRQLAEGLELTTVTPLVPAADPNGAAGVGAGRWGHLPRPTMLAELAARVKSFLSVERLQLVGDPSQRVARVAVACGSGGALLEAAGRLGCDCLVTGEARFHTCLAAEASGVGMVLAGHYASERFAVQSLAEYLAQRLTAVTVWASAREQDPLRWVY